MTENVDHAAAVRVHLWKQMVEQGVASGLCDEIVRKRDVPMALLRDISTRVVIAKKLNPRQMEVLTAASEGLTIEQTAKRLGISKNAVRYHRRLVVFNLDARNMRHALALAVKEGLL